MNDSNTKLQVKSIIKKKMMILLRNDSASVSNDIESSFATQKQGRGFALNSA